MNEFDLLHAALKTPVLLILVVAQGFIFALLFVAIAYRIFNKIADKYIHASEKQADAMTKIADSVTTLTGGMDILKEQARRSDDFATEVRITLRSVESNVNRVEEKINKLISELGVDRRSGDRRTL